VLIPQGWWPTAAGKEDLTQPEETQVCSHAQPPSHDLLSYYSVRDFIALPTLLRFLPLKVQKGIEQ
jgi:hypothetical protein